MRIEDVDFERCKNEYSESMLHDLTKLGLHWDGDVVYQSARQAIYDEFLTGVLHPISYVCRCSRKTLADFAKTHPKSVRTATLDTALSALSDTPNLNAPLIYPRLCLPKNDKTYRPNTQDKLRLVLDDVLGGFYDGLQGMIWDNPTKSLGDVVVKRQNGAINYILACAIDDGLQGVTHVMRGLDILPMTVAQFRLQESCRLPTPDAYFHLPLIHNPDGQKLSKQNLALPIDSTRPSVLLLEALKRLGQPTDDAMQHSSPEEILAFAIKHWTHAPLMRRQSLGVAQ